MTKSKSVDDEIEQFDTNSQRYIDMEEDAPPLRLCPVCLQVSPGALGCDCFIDLHNGQD